MQILPSSQINNLPILEEVLEELRLNVIDHIFEIGDALNLYALNTLELKQKLNLLGLSSIHIGKFISLDINSKEFDYISPEFYKMYRKLNQHRGNKMSMDYVLHSAGMMNTLVHSNTQFYNQDSIFENLSSFFDFSSFRDNQFPELQIGDGYIIVPYSSNRLQVLKRYLATNPIIFNFLPAGYTFIFLSEYRNSYSNGIFQFDNFLNYQDTDSSICFYIDPDSKIKEIKHIGDSVFVEIDPVTEAPVYRTIPPYIKPLYWESEDFNFVREDILKEDNETEAYYHPVFDYDPFLWRDQGISFRDILHSRFTDDSLYQVPLPYYNSITHLNTFPNLDEYLYYYSMVLIQNVLDKSEQGYESWLNNNLFYKDIWLGDYLVETLKGSNRYPEFYDHVKGMESIQAPTYSYASLTNRGESLASQYFQREQKVISKADTLIQQNKKDIISDRRETDLFSFNFSDSYSLWITECSDIQATISLIQNTTGSTTGRYSTNNLTYNLNHLPYLFEDGLPLNIITSLYNMFVNSLTDDEAIFVVKDWLGNIILPSS
jgi:hypothetical protein